MSNVQKVLLFGLILAAGIVPCFAEGVITPGTMVIRSTSTEVPGTPDYQKALNFLAERYDAGQSPIDVRNMASELGAITVKTTRTVATSWTSSGVRAPQDPDDIPTNPTGGPNEPGKPGDQQSYDTCNGTIQFTWSYEYQCDDVGCAWVVTDFEMHLNDVDCGGSP